MNKKLYISKRIKGVQGRTDYYLTESRYKDVSEGVCTYVFGIEIQKISSDETGVEYMQKGRVADLSVSRERVLEFLYLLADNDVLPVSLADICVDFAGEGFFQETGEEEKTA